MNKRPASANVPPPPKQRLMAAPPPAARVPDNLSKPSDDLRDLNFKVPPELHRKFKVVATNWGMSMRDLLESSFNEWVEEHGAAPADSGDLFKRG